MTTWEVCNAAIPRGMKERVAQTLHLSADYIRRWCREPLSNETARAEGFYSPLDRFLDFLDAVFLVSRSGAGLIINYVNARYHRLLCNNASILTLNTQPELNRAGAQLLQQCGHAVDSLMAEGTTRETVFRFIQLRDKTDEILACANQDLLRAEESNDAALKSVSRPVGTVAGGFGAAR